LSSAAEELLHQVESQAVLVTRSEDGMTLLVKGEAPIHIAAYPVKVRDVSGAGDTVAPCSARCSPPRPASSRRCVRPMPPRQWL
jgi:D-beta-D-heptose 7-phosphate kinase/D-beta-D-heptose 1-phosphate adenosyltransferase